MDEKLLGLINDLKVAMADEERVTYKAGHNAGLSEGYDEGYDDGLSEGYDEGYDDGHSKGYKEGVNNNG